VFAYGNPPVELRERFHEARKLILRAWEETEPFSTNGKYHQLRYVNVLPKPIQKRPPIWVPGSGSLETWDLVLDENYCYGHLSFSGLHSAKPMRRCAISIATTSSIRASRCRRVTPRCARSRRWRRM
jgi:alkanesulfonate monooxygenase SsuD/methylene tetrahydromethanopterin reductase-like flavin-dependent oxidoreductase (luciferase family)